LTDRRRPSRDRGARSRKAARAAARTRRPPCTYTLAYPTSHTGTNIHTQLRRATLGHQASCRGPRGQEPRRLVAAAPPPPRVVTDRSVTGVSLCWRGRWLASQGPTPVVLYAGSAFRLWRAALRRPGLVAATSVCPTTAASAPGRAVPSALPRTSGGDKPCLCAARAHRGGRQRAPRERGARPPSPRPRPRPHTRPCLNCILWAGLNQSDCPDHRRHVMPGRIAGPRHGPLNPPCPGRRRQDPPIGLSKTPTAAPRPHTLADFRAQLRPRVAAAAAARDPSPPHEESTQAPAGAAAARGTRNQHRGAQQRSAAAASFVRPGRPALLRGPRHACCLSSTAHAPVHRPGTAEARRPALGRPASPQTRPRVRPLASSHRSSHTR
jgi:hypothetical protein